MLKIPNFMDSDDYLQIPVVQKFCSENNLKLKNTRPECINVIKEYANICDENKQKVITWLEKVAKEGTKDVCYREIYDIPNEYFEKELLENKLHKIFPECPFENVTMYHNTYDRIVINYKIFTDETGKTNKISFCFSSNVLTDISGQAEQGADTVYPVYVDIYLKERFAFGIGKAKSTIYRYNDEKILSAINHIDTQKYIMECVDDIIEKLEIKTDDNQYRMKNRNEKILFNLYTTFSFTPPEVVQEISSANEEVRSFVDMIFEKFLLDAKNKDIAMADMQIFLEKMISINGDNMDIFKEGRDAYLIKVGANDELQMTSIDTKSTDRRMPLQCTEAFFDSKKSVMKGSKCKKLSLCFKRKNSKYFGKVPFEVQFSFRETYGIIKTKQYVEEDDLNNVLQYLFKCAERIQ